MSARGRVLGGGVSGRTHGSAPTRSGRHSEPTENWREDGPCQRGEREWTDGGVWSPRPTGATQVMPSSGPMWASAPTPCGGTRGRHAGVVVPYGWLRRAAAIALGSGAQRSVCAADGRNGWKSEQRSPQKCLSTPDNPTVSLRLPAPFTQGSLGGRGMRIAASLRSLQ